MNQAVLWMLRLYGLVNTVLGVCIFVLAITGLVLVLRTREDAFTVIDRVKQNWIMLMGGASVAAFISVAPLLSGSLTSSIGFLWVIAAVIVGIYWQDIRPGVKEALDNAGGW